MTRPPLDHRGDVLTLYSGLGDLVIGIRCPGCGRQSVVYMVYNGNYFCARETQCGWVMTGPEEGQREPADDRIIIMAYLSQRIEQAPEEDRDELRRLEQYLATYRETDSGSLDYTDAMQQASFAIGGTLADLAVQVERQVRKHLVAELESLKRSTEPAMDYDPIPDQIYNEGVTNAIQVVRGES